MTKNISHLCFSFVFKDLIVFENVCNSVCSMNRMAFAMRFSIQFSNARPDTGDPYRAARARTIPDKYPEVKRLAKKLASFLPYPLRHCGLEPQSIPNHLKKQTGKPIRAFRLSYIDHCNGCRLGGRHDELNALIQLNLNIHAGSQVELHQRVHGLVGRIDDIHQALVRSDLVLIARILVHVR